MLYQRLSEVAEGQPEHPAIVFGNITLTYRSVFEQSARLARILEEKGIHRGSKVALVHANAPEFVLTFLAAARLGAVLVPLNPLFKDEELGYYFGECGVSAVVADGRRAEECGKALEAIGAEAVVVESGDAAGADVSLERLLEAGPLGASRMEETDADIDAVFQYSSGSTGRPKRVPRTHAQLLAEADSAVSTFRLSPDDRIFCAVPLFHTHGQGNCLLAALRSGATLVMLENTSPFLLYRDRALEVLESERVTVFPGVPFMFRMMADASYSPRLTALRLCFSAGTALPRETFDTFHERFGVPVRQLYGCTEAGALTINLDEDPTPTAESVGRPLNGVSVEVKDETDAVVPPGVTGEVVVRTAAMTRGYHGMDDHNSEVFRNGAYRTGDVGHLDADGRLWLTGRKKLFIEVVGNKVDPAEVEDALSTHPAVQESVVVGIPSAIAGEELIKAVVVAASPIEEEALIEHCADRLASFKVPALVEFRDEIPRSPLGKVLRKYLV